VTGSSHALARPVRAPDVADRIAAIDQARLEAELDAQGAALIEGLLTAAECRALAALYAGDEPFRSRVVMARHGFGRGEYKYFAYPLPALIAELRTGLYPLLEDLYGAEVFPLQVAILLSEPGREFTGGEFVMTEQRPRMQSRPMVLPLAQGDAVAFAVHHRPVQGTRGTYRVNLRHGVSRVRSGQRHTVGIIFHDAS
jgi:hypothetical protein